MGPRFRMGRRRGLLVGAAVGAGVANSRARNSQQQSEEVTAPEAKPSDNDQLFAELEKLGQLKDQGILTQEEFDAKKAQILGL